MVKTESQLWRSQYVELTFIEWWAEGNLGGSKRAGQQKAAGSSCVRGSSYQISESSHFLEQRSQSPHMVRFADSKLTRLLDSADCRRCRAVKRRVSTGTRFIDNSSPGS
jgi:hypothetical protein